MTPIEFVYFNRAKLNSKIISESIHLWINNIFGVNQLENGDPEKIRKSCNIYPWQCYEKIFRNNYEQYKLNKDNFRRKQSFHTPSKRFNSLYQSVLDNNEEEEEMPIDNYNIKDQLNSISLFGQCPVEILKKFLTKRNKDMNENKFKLLLSKEENKKEENIINIKNKTINENVIIYVSYNSDNYIIYINDKKALFVLSKDDFSIKYKFTIIGNFIPLTSSIIIDFNNCETLIISNIMENKIILAEKGKLKYQHKICDIPTCLCKCNSNYFYVGTINGYIQKIKITFTTEQDNFKKIDNIIDEGRILGHKYQLVRNILCLNYYSLYYYLNFPLMILARDYLHYFRIEGYFYLHYLN